MTSDIIWNDRDKSPLPSLRQTKCVFTLVSWPEKTGLDPGRQQEGTTGNKGGIYVT